MGIRKHFTEALNTYFGVCELDAIDIFELARGYVGVVVMSLIMLWEIRGL